MQGADWHFLLEERTEISLDHTPVGGPASTTISGEECILLQNCRKTGCVFLTLQK